MRFRRRTVIRERQVVVTEEAHDDPGWQPTIAWHYEPPPARYDPGPPPLQGVDELDPARHVPVTGPAPVFARLVRHPPVTAPWRAHLGFTADLAARAVRQDALQPSELEVAMRRYETAELREQYAEAARNHPRPPVPYPALDEDTLTRDFEPLDLLP